MKHSSLPVFLSSLCSLLSPQASFLILLLLLLQSMLVLTSHLSLQVTEATQHDDRCWEKSFAPKDLPLSRANVPKMQDSLICAYSPVKLLTTWWELLPRNVFLCTRSGSSDASSQQLCWVQKCMAPSLTALMVRYRTSPNAVRVHNPKPTRQLSSRHRAASPPT